MSEELKPWAAHAGVVATYIRRGDEDAALMVYTHKAGHEELTERVVAMLNGAPDPRVAELERERGEARAEVERLRDDLLWCVSELDAVVENESWLPKHDKDPGRLDRVRKAAEPGPKTNNA